MRKAKVPEQDPLSHSSGVKSTQAIFALLSLVAVLYLTLMPFEFRDMAFADALAYFRETAFSPPRLSARQQWIANALMFMPLGFFCALLLTSPAASSLRRVLVVVAVSLFSLAVTVGVEFTQIWIAHRHPSPTDISGNFAGGVLGALIGITIGERLWGKAVALAQERETVSLGLLLSVYTALYVFASLFPFDFLLTAAEIRDHLARHSWGWWAAPAGCDGGVRCLAQDALKPLLAIPVGVWLGSRLRLRFRLTPVACLVAAVGFGVLLELLQLVMYSGIAEGRSAALRALGFAAGVHIAGRQGAILMLHLREKWGLAIALVMGLPYAIAVIVLVSDLTSIGLSAFHWETHRALDQLASLQFLPLYYHYFVAEAAAARSLLFQLITYSPVGILVWLARGHNPRHDALGQYGVWLAASLAAALALLAEGLKLFATGLRPDPTSILLAMAAAAIAVRVCVLLARALEHRNKTVAVTNSPASDSSPSSPPPEETTHTAETAVPPEADAPAWAARVAGALLGIGVIAAALNWPVWSGWLGLGLVAYIAVLMRWPSAWLLVIPAVIPILDFSMLTGFAAVDEFDLLVLASISGVLLVSRRGKGFPPLPAALVILLVVFGSSVLVSAGLALQELGGMAEQGLAVHLSEYNILRSTKGFALALMLFMLLPQSAPDAETALHRYFVPGMVIGLVTVIAVVAWERTTYPGLFNMDSPYRISGLFTDMRLGGPSIETFLVFAMPFALLWLWLRPGILRGLAVLALLLFGLSALLVTYSRAGYLGAAGALALLLVIAGIALFVGQRHSRWGLTAIVLVPALVAGGVAVQGTDTVAAQRMQQIEADLGARLDHWRHALNVQDENWRTTILGQGAGTFPLAYRLSRPPQAMPANFAFQTGNEQSRLMLGAGSSLYINQRVAPPSGDPYRLEVRGSSDQPAMLGVYLCQKHVRYSFECAGERIRFANGDAEQEVFSTDLPTEHLRTEGPRPPRHLTLAVRNHTTGSVIALDEIQLNRPDGTELLRNSDFAAGRQHWYFTTDELWPWRVENQWLEIYFEQGWLGLVAFVLLTTLAMLFLADRAIRNNFSYGLVLAALAGMLTLGIFSSVFYAPRLMLLFYFTLLLGVAAATNPGRPRRHPGRAA